MKTLTRALGVAVAIAALAAASSTYAAYVNYTTGGWSEQFPAPTTPAPGAPWGPNGYPGDTVALQGYSDGFVLAPGTFTMKINTLLWTIDYTYGGTADDYNAWSNLEFTFNALRNMTIDGVSGNLSQGGTLLATWDNDFLSLSGGSAVSFIVQGYEVKVTPLGLASVGGSNFSGSNPWIQPTRDVIAQFEIAPVPEPATMIAGALLLLPLGASAWRTLRKNR